MPPQQSWWNDQFCPKNDGWRSWQPRKQTSIFNFTSIKVDLRHSCLITRVKEISLTIRRGTERHSRREFGCKYVMFKRMTVVLVRILQWGEDEWRQSSRIKNRIYSWQWTGGTGERENYSLNYFLCLWNPGLPTVDCTWTNVYMHSAHNTTLQAFNFVFLLPFKHFTSLGFIFKLTSRPLSRHAAEKDNTAAVYFQTE